MPLPSNLPEFRQHILDALQHCDFCLGGININPEIATEAVDEIVAGVVKEYLRDGKLSACEMIVGQLFLTKFDR